MLCHALCAEKQIARSYNRCLQWPFPPKAIEVGNPLRKPYAPPYAPAKFLPFVDISWSGGLLWRTLSPGNRSGGRPQSGAPKPTHKYVQGTVLGHRG